MQTAEDIDIDFAGHEALQNTLAYIEDLFGADLPFAPGMTFVGARFSACNTATFNAKPDDRSPPEAGAMFSAGAADINPQRSVFRCLGEVAETLSQFTRFRPDGMEILPASAADAQAAARFAETHGARVAAGGWLTGREMLSGAAALVPAGICYRDLCGTPEPGAAFSTGCAGGRTLADAVQAATLELIEREAIALWWFAGAPAKELDAAEVPGLRECVATMRAGRTERRLIFLDLTTEFAIPVVAAVSADAEGKDLAAGFAARLEVGEAAVAAVCELAQMELANLLASAKRQRGMRLTESEAALLDRCRDLSLEDALFKAGTAQKGDAIARPRDVSNLDVMLAEQGIERFVVELTSPILTVPVAKVVCPALQTVPVGYRTERFRAASEKYGLRSGAASRYGPI